MRKPILKNEFDRLTGQIQSIKAGFDLLNDHVIITDENGNILYANKAVENSTGFSIEEILGKNPADLWGGQMGTDFYEKMWHTIKIDKKPYVGEVQNKRKDGSLYWQELHISPILNNEGDVIFFIGIEPNISERKEREKFREEFISIIGHQLRNPLTSIKWTIELLSKSAKLSKKDKERLENIYNENQNLSDFVGDLLILSKLNVISPTEQNIDLASEIEKLITEVKKQNPNVDFYFNKIGQDFSLPTNKSLAMQIFSNIIYNAAEYSDKTGGKVFLVLEQAKNYYYFSCENNGLVIPKEEQSKIFSKFFRASNASQSKEKGTGLGLFLVKMICDKFGWEVSFKSPAPDKKTGTAFFVKILPN